MNLIPLIQHYLESLYALHVDAKAQDYLITEKDLLSFLPAHQTTVFPRELFLVNPEPKDGTVEVALFFAHDLQQNLRTHNPLTSLTNKNIVDFCMLIEGMSHFVCYLHKAALNRPITELELELQAEIDKFLLLNLSTMSTLSTKSRDHNPNQILTLLFEGYTTHPHLTTVQETRYHTANDLACRYCHRLSDWIRQHDHKKLMQEVRAFYPLSQEEKIARILS